MPLWKVIVVFIIIYSVGVNWWYIGGKFVLRYFVTRKYRVVIGGCYAMNCTNRSKSLHRIPPATDKLKRKQWIHNMRRDIRNIDVESIRLCSNHFTHDCFERALCAELLGQESKSRLKADAVPTIFTFSV